MPHLSTNFPETSEEEDNFLIAAMGEMEVEYRTLLFLTAKPSCEEIRMPQLGLRCVQLELLCAAYSINWR